MMAVGITREEARLRNLQGAIFKFDDASFMTRACGRITQVMVFDGRRFTLHEAIGDRNIQGATILKADVEEFTRIFDSTERSEEESFMLDQIGDIDFAVAVHTPEMSTGLICHELCHVLYFYDNKHRERVTFLWNRLEEQVRTEIVSRLQNSGYEEVELVDEWCAHLFYGFDDRQTLMEHNTPLSEFCKALENEFLSVESWSGFRRLS